MQTDDCYDVPLMVGEVLSMFPNSRVVRVKFREYVEKPVDTDKEKLLRNAFGSLRDKK
jgi:hypothetical protein